MGKKLQRKFNIKSQIGIKNRKLPLNFLRNYGFVDEEVKLKQ